MTAPQADLEEAWIGRRVERLVGGRVRAIRAVHRGYTPAIRRLVTMTDGRSYFAKIGASPRTAEELRREHQVYRTLDADFMPRLLGWEDDGQRPLLLLEDLSDAYWPPPWRAGDVEQVLETLPAMWASTVPDLPAMAEAPYLLEGWKRVAADPAPFLSLNLVTPAWLEQSLPRLLAVDTLAVARGEALLHNDLRSDNLCLRGGLVRIIDWNLAKRGNPDLDLGFWLPSLQAEGGPPPEQLLPNAPGVATVVSGYFAAAAGLPTIPEAPRVRHVQRVQLRTALPWVIRELGLNGVME